jgi:hypothetical protein
LSYYIHQTPGRIRVRTPAVKNSLEKAAHAVALLTDLTGVKTVVSNASTGSITVTYQAHLLCPSLIINALAQHGFLIGVVGFPKRSERPWANLASSPALTLNLSPEAKKMLKLAAKLVLPLLIERALGRPGKVLAAALF